MSAQTVSFYAGLGVGNILEQEYNPAKGAIFLGLNYTNDSKWEYNLEYSFIGALFPIDHIDEADTVTGLYMISAYTSRSSMLMFKM